MGEDAQAITNCLQVIENLTDIAPQEVTLRFVKVPKLLPWLIKRVRHTNSDYNRTYAAEILGIFLQNQLFCRQAMTKHEGVDRLLRGIAVYRKTDPQDTEESEFVQNTFDCLCSLMLHKEHQISFGKAQGLELMIRMMSQRKYASTLALRLSNHALRHCPVNCQIFVEKLGLKTLFTMFMRKGPRLKKQVERDAEEHIVSIVQSLCRYC